jgi:ribose transport system substrate-binding protein
LFPAAAKKKRPNGGRRRQRAAGKKLKLAFVSNNAATFWTIARTGCDAAAKELGNVDVDFRIPATGSAAEQQQILDDLVAKGVDGIAVSPIDPANQTDFLNKIAGETLLICCDSDAADSKRVCYIGTDNEAAGVEAGQADQGSVAQRRQDHGVRRLRDAQNAKDRSGGIKKELEGSNISRSLTSAPTTPTRSARRKMPRTRS